TGTPREGSARARRRRRTERAGALEPARPKGAPMKLIENVCLAAALLAASAGVACQADSGYAHSDATAERMEDLQESVRELGVKIESSVASLSDVVASATSDPKPAFKRYKKELSAAQSARAQCEKYFESIRTECQAYFTQWEADMATVTDEDLRETADARRKKLEQAIARVSKSMETARTELDTFMTSLQDMATFLGNDLSPTAIDSIESKSKKAKKDSEEIVDKLDELAQVLEKDAPQFRTASEPKPAA
ncbi:MAG TPA: DUF2959 family protein, partial [Planctomycetota bacterium]|nr:DUF2959 family protein [Planctomycetota bacterium]